jgi:hypothetical protein
MSPWQEWKKKNAERQASGVVRPWDVVNPDTEYAPVDEIARRYKMCEECDMFLKSKQCSECGCFMPLKTRLKMAQCPLGKW